VRHRLRRPAKAVPAQARTGGPRCGDRARGRRRRRADSARYRRDGSPALGRRDPRARRELHLAVRRRALRAVARRVHRGRDRGRPGRCRARRDARRHGRCRRPCARRCERRLSGRGRARRSRTRPGPRAPRSRPGRDHRHRGSWPHQPRWPRWHRARGALGPADPRGCGYQAGLERRRRPPHRSRADRRDAARPPGTRPWPRPDLDRGPRARACGSRRAAWSRAPRPPR
jgi:hypothetical protein